MGQSRGWLTRRNSITPSLAFFVNSEFVFTFIPFITGIAQEATGCKKGDIRDREEILTTLHRITAYLPYLDTLLHFNETHSAVSCDGETVVVAETRDVHSHECACLNRLPHRGSRQEIEGYCNLIEYLENGESRIDENFLAVDEHLSKYNVRREFNDVSLPPWKIKLLDTVPRSSRELRRAHWMHCHGAMPAFRAPPASDPVDAWRPIGRGDMDH